MSSSSINTATATNTTRSILKKGTALEGLQIYKGQQPVIAQDDSDYPAWLWTLLDDPSMISSGASSTTMSESADQKLKWGHEFEGMKREIKKERKQQIREQNTKLRKKSS
jgi:large subunit ribosomal protein L54